MYLESFSGWNVVNACVRDKCVCFYFKQCIDKEDSFYVWTKKGEGLREKEGEGLPIALK